MASIDASTSGAGGIITTADNTGTLVLMLVLHKILHLMFIQKFSFLMKNLILIVILIHQQIIDLLQL